MLTGISKKIELAANVAIFIVACLLATVLVNNYLWPKRNQQFSSEEPNDSQRITTTQLSSLNIDWKQSKQTLVLAISTTCHFCTDSASFYQRLVRSKGKTRMVAALPQSTQVGEEYLKRLGVSVDEVRQIGLDKIGVRGTPTLLLVDESGVVKNSWVGKLLPDEEANIISKL